nr:enzymatic polyprotein [Tanacetum cinerariifolium]
MKNILTAKEKEEMGRPTVKNFQRLLDSLTNYNEVHATMLFYPKKRRNIGPKAVFTPEASPKDIYDYYVHGLVGTIYINGETLKELQEFPLKNSMTGGSFEVSDDSQYSFHVGNLRLEETASVHIRISSNDTLLLDSNFPQILEGVHIDFLLKFFMQEGICHVKLMEMPSFICSYREENSDCVNLGYSKDPTTSHCFFPWGRIHLSIVSFLLNASISVFIASLQTLDSKACSMKVGISSKYKEVVKIWASGDKFPLAMFAIGYLDLRASFSRVYLFRVTPLLVLGGSSYLTDDSGDSLFSYVSQSMFASERVGETTLEWRDHRLWYCFLDVFSFKEVTVHCGEYVSFARAVAPVPVLVNSISREQHFSAHGSILERSIF